MDLFVRVWIALIIMGVAGYCIGYLVGYYHGKENK